MMQPEQFWILHYFDARAPRIFDETEFEQARDVAYRSDDLDAGGFEFFELGVDIGE